MLKHRKSKKKNQARSTSSSTLVLSSGLCWGRRCCVRRGCGRQGCRGGTRHSGRRGKMVGEVDDVVGDGIAWVVRLHGDEAAVDVEETEKLRCMLTAWIRWRRWHKWGWRKRGVGVGEGARGRGGGADERGGGEEMMRNEAMRKKPDTFVRRRSPEAEHYRYELTKIATSLRELVWGAYSSFFSPNFQFHKSCKFSPIIYSYSRIYNIKIIKYI